MINVDQQIMLIRISATEKLAVSESACVARMLANRKTTARSISGTVAMNDNVNAGLRTSVCWKNAENPTKKAKFAAELNRLITRFDQSVDVFQIDFRHVRTR